MDVKRTVEVVRLEDGRIAWVWDRQSEDLVSHVLDVCHDDLDEVQALMKSRDGAGL